MLLKDVFHLDSFQSYFEKGGWLDMGENLLGVLNTLINLFYGLIKLLYSALDYVIDKLFNLNLLAKSLPALFSTASTIYTRLFQVLGILVFTIVIVLVVRDFFEKGIAKALIRLGVFTLIYIGSLTFFQEGAPKVLEMNTISQNVQGQLVDLTSGSLSKINNQDTQKLLGNTQGADGTTNIRNLIFDEFVLKPYALLNYGKTDLSKAQFEEYLVPTSQSYDKEKVGEIKDKIKTDAEKNDYLTSDRMTEKIAVLINSLLMLFIVGTAVLMIGLANILIQLLLYALVFLLPTLFFFALLPNLHNLLKNGFVLLGSLFVGKIALGLGFGVLFSILNLLDSFFVVTNIVTMLVGLLVKLLLGFFIWKNKGQILHSLTKGNANLRDFKGVPLPSWTNHQQKKQDQQHRSNQYEEQVYKTDTAANNYQLSQWQVENERQQQELQDNVLVQATKEEPSFSSYPDSEPIVAKNEPIPTVPINEEDRETPSSPETIYAPNSMVYSEEAHSPMGEEQTLFSQEMTVDEAPFSDEEPPEEYSSIPVKESFADSDESVQSAPPKIGQEQMNQPVNLQKKEQRLKPISKEEAVGLQKELAALRDEPLLEEPAYEER